MKQKLYALDAFFIEKVKLSENDPCMNILLCPYKNKRKRMPTVDPITRCPNVPFKLKSETESDFDGH